METCDVLIVGGGPAGSTCARELQRAGLDVIVLDKAQFPRDKICAGWVTPAVMESLGIDPDEYGRNHTLQPISAFRTSRLGDDPILTRFDHVISYGIRRCEFDDYLLRRCGARLRLGEKLSSIEKQGAHWIINGNIKTPLVIGAGGHYCPVARFMGAKLGAAELPVAAQEIEFVLNDDQLRHCPVEADTPELFFTRDLKGYGWIFRKGNYLNIGLGRQDNNKLAGHVDDFVTQLQQAGRIPADLPKFSGHAYLLYPDAPRKVLMDNMLLIGDAAGLAYPQSGEGIRPAIESALLAANTIISADHDYSAARLQAYERALAERFGKRGRGLLGQLVPHALKQQLAGLLMRMPWFARHVIIDRWFLHSQQAPLLPGI
ncbi:MAG: NAD(P)/FAD-dependent oxidoreductase [Granulosicoccaceae bacterium]|jgi:geranylgeranyl reductase family protein